jgi:hypothetical protein
MSAINPGIGGYPATKWDANQKDHADPRLSYWPPRDFRVLIYIYDKYLS